MPLMTVFCNSLSCCLYAMSQDIEFYFRRWRSSLYTILSESRHTGRDAGPVRARSESSAMDGNSELTSA